LFSFFLYFFLFCIFFLFYFFFFSSRRRHTRFSRDWSSDVCSSDLTRFLITTTGELLFRGEKTRAGGDPVLVTHDSMFGHGALQWDYGRLASGLRRSAFAPITSCAASASPLACAARRASAAPFFARRFPTKWRRARRTAAASTCCSGSSRRPRRAGGPRPGCTG